MDTSILLWEQWQQQVKQVFADMQGHQKKALALVVIASS
jgi:hypothetical protein